MDLTQTTRAPLPGPFQGQSMNCRACHLVDEQADFRGGGVRSYADFARRSPVPEREDGRVTALRNSPALVDATLVRSGPFLLHFDGEFASVADLVKGTLTGRNFGWLADESPTAVAHIAAVVRGDDGRGALAADFGALPYPVLLSGTDPSIPDKLRLPPAFRIDAGDASDEQILDAVADLIGAYVESLVFARDTNGELDGSPYDRFLRKNGLPRRPETGESDLAYSRRLRAQIEALSRPRYVDLDDGAFELHAQEFIFGPRELQGLRIFFAEQENAAGGVGNCIACHAAPNFTDFSLHNTGAAQDEYDAVHGPGTFAAVAVPGLEERNDAPEVYLPPSPSHPDAVGIFAGVPTADAPGRTDLGMWNVFANPALPAPQSELEALLCERSGLPPAQCDDAQLLPAAIALFKTPGLRSLGQSAPYLHTGREDTLEDVIDFYIRESALARAGAVRNAAPELSGIALTADDVEPLAAFLRALNEDYD